MVNGSFKKMIRKKFNVLESGESVKGVRVRKEENAQWGRTAKNWVISTGPLASLFAHSLAPLTHLLAPHSSLCSAALIHLLARSITHS